ncbi:hypothetical protein CYMTET_14824 [Cymbomonas tetramitiformis]|uniref:Signal peptide peptidase n=1 Tax=Cymbomonas tetramitiformis TaxID=36881 RepID=A0AAE0GF93_9CHLO|nr:hypothetical protein CYMTET_14824 [Cymbomonas tetramitiformis]|eukprot:gene3085-3915_t
MSASEARDSDVKDAQTSSDENLLVPVPLAHAALVALQVAPLFMNVPTDPSIIATASLAVYIGCHRSVKPVAMAETMTKKDAMKFPIIGSCVLFGLFLVFKYLPKDLVNAVLTAYFVFLGVIALTATLLPFVAVLFPTSLQERVLRFGTLRVPFLMKEEDALDCSCTTPQIFSGILSTCFCIWYFMEKHWLANNALGLAFSIQGIEFLSVGSVSTGAILLSGLFFYDIFWVFCTPVMVSVAKSFDAPIKLLFPRPSDAEKAFSMLGLGDIVVPGIFVAIMLRYDATRDTGKPFFNITFFGYVLGLVTTVFVMNFFNAAQPALLYIVPGVLLTSGARCWLRGEYTELMAYDEGGAFSESEGTTEADKKSE